MSIQGSSPLLMATVSAGTRPEARERSSATIARGSTASWRSQPGTVNATGSIACAEDTPSAQGCTFAL
jgi:hypothetical protein